MNYDNWKATNVDLERLTMFDDLCTGTENTIDRLIKGAVEKVQSQLIGHVEVHHCLVEVLNESDEPTVATALLGVDVNIELRAVPIENRMAPAASIAELLESLADEIRRAAR